MNSLYVLLVAANPFHQFSISSGFSQSDLVDLPLGRKRFHQKLPQILKSLRHDPIFSPDLAQALQFMEYASVAALEN